MAKVPLSQIRALLAEALTSIEHADAASVGAKMAKALEPFVKNFDDLDNDAQQFVDGLLNFMNDHARKTFADLPDSPDKRRLFRKYSLLEGEVISARASLDKLAESRSIQGDALLAAESFVVEAIQQAIFIIHEVSKTTRSGYQDAALMATFTSVIDDLLAATHLFGHGYCNQAANILRTAHESLEKAELFTIDSDAAELWATGSSQECWNKMRPALVRKRLGREKHDPFYSILSEVGTHTSFRGFQNRAGQDIDDSSTIPKLRIWVGGTKIIIVIHMTALWTMYEAMSLILGMTKAYARDLNYEDASVAIDELLAKFHVALSTHLIKEIEGLGYDVTAMEEFLTSGFGGAWPANPSTNDPDTCQSDS